MTDEEKPKAKRISWVWGIPLSALVCFCGRPCARGTSDDPPERAVPQAQLKFEADVGELQRLIQAELQAAKVAENQIQKDQAYEKFDAFQKNLYRNPVAVADWECRVKRVSDERSADCIHGTINYTVKHAESMAPLFGRIAAGACLRVSGSIGREQSLTKDGAITAPEFRLEATSSALCN